MAEPAPEKLAFTGGRNLTDEDERKIASTIALLVTQPWTELRFGGARGADTIALIAAAQFAPNIPRFVIVPGKVDQQPSESQIAIRKHATQIVEMNLPLYDKASYQARNIALITGATKVVAFWNGRPGGTLNCIKAARQLKIPVETVTIEGGT